MRDRYGPVLAAAALYAVITFQVMAYWISPRFPKLDARSNFQPHAKRINRSGLREEYRHPYLPLSITTGVRKIPLLMRASSRSDIIRWAERHCQGQFEFHTIHDRRAVDGRSMVGALALTACNNSGSISKDVYLYMLDERGPKLGVWVLMYFGRNQLPNRSFFEVETARIDFQTRDLMFLTMKGEVNASIPVAAEIEAAEAWFQMRTP